MRRLLVTVDSLRLDHYRFMEHTREFLGDSSPRAFAVATATMGAFPQILTGRYDASAKISPSESFLNEINDPSIGITTNRLTSSRYGYDDGFDEFISPISRKEESLKDVIAARVPNGTLYRVAARLWSTYQKLTPRTVGKSFRQTSGVVSDFLEFTESRDDWFGWLHLMEPHHPYDPDETKLSRAKAQVASREAISTGDPSDSELVKSLYRQEVVEIDQQLKRLWDEIPDDTQVIFTADHGELLGENGIWGHPGQTFHPDILRVPFATRNVELESNVVSSVDIGAHLLDRDWRESQLNREVAFASMDEMKCAFDTTHMLTENDRYTLDGSDTDPSRKLQRALESFHPSTITKQDAAREDLQALGYLDE